MYLSAAENNKKPDLGIAVAKRLAKRAVDRNRLKRLIRELFRAEQSTNLKSDVVVKLNKPIGRETRGRLRKKEQIDNLKEIKSYREI